MKRYLLLLFVFCSLTDYVMGDVIQYLNHYCWRSDIQTDRYCRKNDNDPKVLPHFNDINSWDSYDYDNRKDDKRTFQMEDYTFAYWGHFHYPEEKYYPGEEPKSYLIQYHAQWAYIVTYDTKGGSVMEPDTCLIKITSTGTTKAHDEFSDFKEPISKPTRKDYTFTGWYTDSDCLNLCEFKGQVTGNKTLYAGWEYTPEAEVNYYSVSLELAPGINLHNLSAGELTIEDGDHLFLQFWPEDPTLTADDILLLIDGVETAFTPSADGRGGSYILNPIEKDHSIEIRLRQGAIDPDPNPDITGNADLTENGIQLRITNYELRIINSGPAVDVAVYNITGKNFAQLRALQGSKSIALPAGIYIVRTPEEAFKVVIP